MKFEVAETIYENRNWEVRALPNLRWCLEEIPMIDDNINSNEVVRTDLTIGSNSLLVC